MNHALKLFDTIETVDRIALADALEKRLNHPLEALIEVKLLTGEESKTGCPIDELPGLIDHIASNCPHLLLRGFMGMGPWNPDPETARPFYRKLKELFDRSRNPQKNSILYRWASADIFTWQFRKARPRRTGEHFRLNRARKQADSDDDII